ncbi:MULTISPECIES: DUF1656 domain-containing protein [unclassified Acinetobacter]|uniref:DUF1656 domain-containing protein n=1 Tax=unclassified Acinetobacter TaxID=196816 RepID=UPI00103F7206|nr:MULTISPECIES: DUF1656 domain-containing protein [unclassified Acinetobacter]TCB12014.1 DUF1656 domain-containing protein [Acinetobacter sp. ANC 4641]TCB26471.1 DUF1656 domain-containing protein [Acinetobacter sp. ANC 4633]
MGEFNLYGVFVPSLLIQALLAYIVFMLLGKWTDRLIQRDWVAFPGIFNLSLYMVCLLLTHWVFAQFSY